MTDDPLLSKFKSIFGSPPPTPSTPKPSLPPSLSPPQAADGRNPYEAFENNKKILNGVQIRCWRTGLCYSIDYPHMSPRVFEFISGEKLSFDGGGYGVVAKGRNLRDIVLALDLHMCGFIQDFHPKHFILPEPVDPNAAFVESIEVRVLRPAPRD